MKFTGCKNRNESEINRLNAESVSFRLDEVLDVVSMAIGPQAFDKELEIACCVASDVPCNLQGDVVWLKKILVSMFNCAMGYASQQQVVMNIARSEVGGKGVELQFSVSGVGACFDVGVGAMFVPEYRMSQPGSSKFVGAHGFVSAYGFDDDYAVVGEGSVSRADDDFEIVISKLLAEFMGGSLRHEADDSGRGVLYFTAWFDVVEQVDATDKLVVAPGLHVLVAANVQNGGVKNPDVTLAVEFNKSSRKADVYSVELGAGSFSGNAYITDVA